MSSFNFGNLNSHDSFEVGWHIYSWSLKQSFHFQDVFFNDVSFGNKRSNFLDSVEQGCDYCFWMIHYRSLANALTNVEQTNQLLFPEFYCNQQEPSVADRDLVDQPNLDGEVGGQPRVSGHQPGLHVQGEVCASFKTSKLAQGVHLKLPRPGGEGEVQHREQDLRNGANLFEIRQLPKLLGEVTRLTCKLLSLAPVAMLTTLTILNALTLLTLPMLLRKPDLSPVTGQRATGARAFPSCKRSRRSGTPATSSSKNKK